jgi:hypothetical protein
MRKRRAVKGAQLSVALSGDYFRIGGENEAAGAAVAAVLAVE